MSIEKIPNNSSSEKDSEIEIITPIGASGEKIPEERERFRLEEKKREGKLLSQRETARLRELELVGNTKEEKTEETETAEETNNETVLPELDEEEVIAVAHEQRNKEDQDDNENNEETNLENIPSVTEEDDTANEEELIATLHSQRKEGQIEGDERSEETQNDVENNNEDGGNGDGNEGPNQGQETMESVNQTLENARERFAELDNEAERWARVMGRPKREFEEQGGAANREYAEARNQYMNALVIYRQSLLGGNVLGQNETRQERIQEVARETIAREANYLYDAKTNVRLEGLANEGVGNRERVGRVFGRVTDWYRRLPLRYKLLTSAVFIGGASGAAVVGGTTGVAIAAAAFVGSQAQRALGGVATFASLEGVMKRSQERGAEREVTRDFAEGLENRLSNRDEEIEERIIQITGRKRWEMYRRYIIGGTAGVLVGSGLVGKAIGSITDWFGGDDVPEIEKTIIPPESTPPVSPEQIFDFKETVESGDSVWSITEEKLKNYFGDDFDKLGEAKQTHLIDQIKDKIAENPEKFGLEMGQDIDNLKTGQEIDFSKVMEGSVLKKMFESADNLSEVDINSILENNDKIEDWVKANPDAKLDSEKVQEILTGKVEGGDNVKVNDINIPNIGEAIHGDSQTIKDSFDAVDIEKKMTETYEFGELQQKIQGFNVGAEQTKALTDLYLSNWSGNESPEKIGEVLKNIFGKDYPRVDEFFSSAKQITKDAAGNIHIVLDQLDWLSNDVDAWDIKLTPDGKISADGPLLWKVEEQPISSKSLEEVKTKILAIMENVNDRR